MPRLLVLITALALQGSPVLAMELRGECTVHFAGSSTLHDFDGTGNCMPFVLQATENPNGESFVPETVLIVPVAGMQTGNSSRDEKMRDMFDAAHFPQISGILDGAPLLELRRHLHDAARGSHSFPIRMRIRDVESPIAARVTRLTDDAGGLNVDLEFPVSLNAYQLEPPSVLGLIHVADEVRVKVSLHVAPLSAPWQPPATEQTAPR
jgi:hypothetical protein